MAKILLTISYNPSTHGIQQLFFTPCAISTDELSILTFVPSFSKELRVLITSSDFNKLNAFDFPNDCEANKAQRIDKLLSPSIFTVFLKMKEDLESY